MLVAESAKRLGAIYKRSQRGDLAPQGAARMRSSLLQILDLLTLHERVLWHIDELDKFFAGAEGEATPRSEWSASIFSDLWSALDKSLPIETYLTMEDRPGVKDPTINADFLHQRVNGGLFIIGSGTWQNLFTRDGGPRIGFSNSTKTTPLGISVRDIQTSNLISPELLARFNSNFIILGYPERKEIEQIVKATGIAKLAKETRYQITDEDLDFSRGGYRVLEALLSRLLLLQYQRLRRTPSPIIRPVIYSGNKIDPVTPNV